MQCTWNKLTGKDPDDFRKNPRAIWWQNLKEVTVNGDHEATFVLNRPQPSFLMMFASGYTPVYPCHVSTKDMRTNPIGTGPFKFVEFKRGDSVKFARNPDYWKKGKPHVDAIEWKVIENRSTRILAFVAGEFDMTFGTDVTIPLLKDVTSQAPKAVCELAPTYVSSNLIINPKAAPFSDPKIRRAMALAIDRKAFIDILSNGKDDISGVMLPPPAGRMGHAARGAAEAAGIFSRCGEEPSRGPQDHGRSRLQRSQAAPCQGLRRATSRFTAILR